MLATTESSTLFPGNNSPVTAYAIIWPSLDPAHVKVRTIAPGTGTVAVAAGVATFSDAQALEIGGRVRIATVVYIIATRVSSTVYTFTLRPTISATTFWLPDTYTELSPSDFSYTLDGSGVLNGIITDVAVATTWLVLVFRQTPVLQEVTLPTAGALPAATLERMADRQTMIEQETRSLVDGTVQATGTFQPLNANLTALSALTLTQNSFYARTAVGSGVADKVITIGGDFSLAGNELSIASAGDVVGPASAPKYSVALFDSTTGKAITGALGTNPDTTPTVNAGTITNTTARPLTISQTWNNAALVGRLHILNAILTAADAASTIQEWQTNGSNRGKLMNTGEFRLLDGSAALPTFAFGAATGTGMYRDTAGGALAFSVAGTTVAGILTTVFEVFERFLVTMSAASRFEVNDTFVKAFRDFLPGSDNARDLGSLALRWKTLFLSGDMTVQNAAILGFIANDDSAVDIASAATIAPTKPVTTITGTAAIVTITPPAFIATGGGTIILIPDAAFTWTNAGNIAIAGTAVAKKALHMTWRSFVGKWYPSYVA